jgi:hypothetical protein
LARLSALAKAKWAKAKRAAKARLYLFVSDQPQALFDKAVAPFFGLQLAFPSLEH